ncbi:MAG: NADH-quinone oxidoreductase subunit A [Planctomycetota bacterium]|nr:MAG: NADH-quinone oxidoreductase subunit A [Planctomycetota bacterium]
MRTEYLPILVLLLLILGFVTVYLLVSTLLVRQRETPSEGTADQRGMDRQQDPQGQIPGAFSSKFFFIAVLSLLFVIGLVLLIPWAVNLRKLSGEGHGPFLFFEMLSFVIILALGLLYFWRKGGLKWD